MREKKLNRKIFLLVLLVWISGEVNSQIITEKEIFRSTYKGKADANNFIYDEKSGGYCYVYYLEKEKKTFIISDNSTSEKYDFISTQDIKFDKDGNYFVTAGNYKADYGIDNYFLIVNGKQVLNYNYIQTYDSYINKKGEFVFIFLEKDLYRFGYYSKGKPFRQSAGYEFIRPVFDYSASSYYYEGDAEGYTEENFYKNENGERAYIASSNGKAKIIFETREISTDYSDINEISFSKNKNNELSYIAKKEARFYEKSGNEFVVSGSKEYDNFDIVSIPLMFNTQNDPVYIAGDSINENLIIFYPVEGNQKQTTTADSGDTLDFNMTLTEFKLNQNDDLSFLGVKEIKIPSSNPGGINSYDEYYYQTFLVNGGTANELGYSIGEIKRNENNDMLYSGIADLGKKDRLLILNYGASRIIINRDNFDDIYEYGFTPSNEIYYVGQNYEDTLKKKQEGTFLYIGEKLIGKYEYLSFQSSGERPSILKFDSKGNYSYVAEQRADTNLYEYIIYTNGVRNEFPANIKSNSKMFSYISDLVYTSNGKLFFIGDIYDKTNIKNIKKELIVDNKSLGKVYDTISRVRNDRDKNEVSFLGSRGKAIYKVSVRF